MHSTRRLVRLIGCSTSLVVLPLAFAQQAPNLPAAPTAAQLAKYDANHNGVLDPAELAALRAESNATIPSEAERVVELSPFTVQADDDVGYVATSSLAGSRLNTSLKDTAASLSVLTKEFMDDIAATSVTDALAWSTNSQLDIQDTLALASSSDDVNSTFSVFDRFRIRGLSATLTKNYFPWELPTDTYNSDRVEEARGPNSILFGIGSAGGVINQSSKKALLARDIRSGTIGVSSHGGYRATLDVNQRVGKKLAVRFNGVYDYTKSDRNFVFSRKRMADVALTYKLTDSTTLRGEYETGNNVDNVGTNQQATDQFTNWVNAGSKLIAAPIPSNQNASYGLARYGSAPIVTYIGNSDTVLNVANMYRSNGADWALPEDVVPYSVSVGGPGDLRNPKFDTTTVSLEQRFGRNTFAELAFNHQQYHTFNQQVNSGVRLYIDPNVNLPNGQPNPNAGKYYIESESWAWNFGARNDTTRLTLSHELDAGKWGNYRVAGMGEYDWRSRQSTQMIEAWADHPFNATPENAANIVIRRQYVDPADPGSFYYKNPMGFGLIHDLVDPVSGKTLNSIWIPRRDVQVRDNPEKQKSVLLALQARYFKDRLVLGLGYRMDKLDTLTRGAKRDANGYFTTDYANNTFDHYDGRTKTIGAVYHVTPLISVFYNHSDNFSLPPNVFIVPDGHRAGNPEGQGTDYGLAFTLADGKLFARVNYYETKQANQASSIYGGTGTAPSAVGNKILDALVDAGEITEAEADARRVVNTGATYSNLVKGYEFNLTANPTKNWRVQGNFSYTTGYISEVAPEVQAWAATMIPYFEGFDPQLAVGNQTLQQAIASWEEYNDDQLATVGVTLPGNRKYKVNLFTTYSFNEGMLRGLRVGGGYRHQSKLPIGQYADGSIQYGPSWWDSSAMVGYRFAKSPIPWLKRLNLQLNINNLFNNDEPYVLRRSQDTPEQVRRIRIREGISWRFTANFDF